MKYIEYNLLEDEKIVHASHAHWIVFWPPAFVTVVLLGGWIFIPGLLRRSVTYLQNNEAVAGMLGGHSIPVYNQWGATSLETLGIIVLVCAVWLLFAWVKYITSEFGVTTHRVIVKRGWIFRKTNELLLGSVESVHLDQSIPGRLLGYGTLTLIGRGSTPDPLKNIPSPKTFQHALEEQNAKMRSGVKNS